MAHMQGKLRVRDYGNAGHYSARTVLEGVRCVNALHTGHGAVARGDALEAAFSPYNSTPKDNIERAVACWNFCEPLSTETLLACENLGDAIKAELAKRDEIIAELRRALAMSGTATA